MVRTLPIIAGAVSLLFLQASWPGTEPVLAMSADAPSKSEQKAIERGRTFAINRCADCHAVEPGQVSPNASAPEFEAVANAPGLTRASLSSWLNTSHDFPREMYFAIPEEKIDDLVSYMLTMRSEDYEPVVR